MYSIFSYTFFRRIFGVIGVCVTFLLCANVDQAPKYWSCSAGTKVVVETGWVTNGTCNITYWGTGTVTHIDKPHIQPCPGVDKD